MWGKVSVISGGIIAVLAFVTTVITNVGTIKETIDKLFSSSGADVKLLQSRLIFSSPSIPIPDEVPGIDFSATMPAGFQNGEEVELGEGQILIDLQQVAQGDPLNHHKFEEIDDLAAVVIERHLGRSEEGLGLNQLLALAIEGRKSRLADRFVLIDPVELTKFTLAQLRVLIQKNTVPSLGSCKIRVYYPSGDSKETYNSIDLPAGTWKNYYEFGLLLPKDLQNKSKVTSKWEAVLTCDANGKAAADGPVPLMVGP